MSPGAAAPTRVAFLSDAMPQRNGVGTYYGDLIDQLHGSRVTAALFGPGDPRSELFTVPLPGDSTQRLSLPSPRQLAKQMGALKPSVVVVATPGPYGLLGARIARRLGARVIIGFHTHLEKLTDIYWSSLFGRFSRRYLEVTHRHLLRHGTVTLANSEEMVEIARRLGAGDVRLIGTLLAQPFLAPAAPPPREGVERLLFAGRLAPEKNIEAIVQAAEHLPEMSFSIVGEGPQRPLVEEAARRLANVRALGWIGRSELAALIDEHDLMLLPSRVESFGTAGLEGMARARPVLTSRHCGMVQWECLRSALYEIHPGEPLHQAIRRVAEVPPAERREVGERARAAALELNRESLAHWLELLGEDDELATPPA
ncbi:MAG: glycosyltransferase [Thermoanaerobaculia bacterium]|nr:glycosyltransferase [Thermoanaerobaculia bacterium]